MSTSCRAVVHTSVGPTKNCARWTIDDTTQQPARRGPSWFKNNPGTHQVILTDRDAPPPDTTAFQPDEQLPAGAVACTIVGGKTTGRRGRTTRQHHPNPDLTSPGVQALIYSPYDDDRRGFLTAHIGSDAESLLQHALWALDDNQFDSCVQQETYLALHYAADQLTDTQLEYCVQKKPGWALHYAADRLTNVQFNNCVRQAPWTALYSVADRLTDVQFDDCAQKDPGAALEYVADRLTDVQLEYCAQEAPRKALQYAAVRMTDVQLDHCVQKEQRAALCYAADRLNTIQINQLIQEMPLEVLEHAPHKLNNLQTVALAISNPKETLLYAGQFIPPRAFEALLETLPETLEPWFVESFADRWAPVLHGARLQKLASRLQNS